MSGNTTEAPKAVVKKLSPSFFITRDKKITILPPKQALLVKKALKVQASPYKDQVIYSTINNCDKPGDFRSLVLRNQLHKVSNHSRTVASFVTHDKKLVEKTSDKITQLIGKKNYDDVFIALCSVINQELKVRAMLALLTENTPVEEGKSDEESKTFVERACQTDEISKEIFYDRKKRIKRRIISDVKKTSSNHCNRNVITSEKTLSSRTIDTAKTGSQSLPDLQLDEESNCSILSTSHLSVCSDILNGEVSKLLSLTDNSMRTTTTATEVENSKPPKTEVNFLDKRYPDESAMPIPSGAVDQFHMATPEILKHKTPEERKRLLWHQAYIDWKLCLERDENGNMPLHLAVQNNDVDLIRRQCLVLRARGHCLDTEANGMSALELALKSDASPACTRTLLDCGASPLRSDAEQRNALHLAAEAHPAHAREVLAAMTKRAREIISDYEELQYPGLMEKSDEEVAKHLLMQVSVLYDREGYTPLILASRVGNPEVVKLLVMATPETINTEMPNTGNTALFTAVAEACMNVTDSANRTNVADNYIKTIETLIEHGADPEIENRTGIKVSDLLQEFNIKSLSLLIANRITSRYFGQNQTVQNESKEYETFMLLKGVDGKMTLIPRVDPKKEKKVKSCTDDDGKKGQGDVRLLTKPTSAPAASSMSIKKRTTIMPKVYTVAGPAKSTLVTPKNVILAKKAGLVADLKIASQTRVESSNCIVLKNEKLPVNNRVTFDHARELAAGKKELATGPSLIAGMRSGSPGNVSLPDLSVADNHHKRKSQGMSAENEKVGCKKLKTPEG